MNCMFLVFFTTMWAILYTYVCGKEIECIQGVADIYSILANGRTCFNSSSVDDFEQDVNNCSRCSWSEEGKKDNYFIFQITYADYTFLKLRNKKNSTCNYTENDVIMECKRGEKTIEPIKSCIVDQCLNQQTSGVMKDNETGKLVITSKEATINQGIIVVAVVGGVIFIVIIILAIYGQKSFIKRCCSVLSMTPTRNSDRRENASAASSRPVEMSVYEAIPDKNVYDHLHEKPKTVPKPGRYSTMKEIREIRQNKTDETSQPVEEEIVELGVKNDGKNKNNTFQILQQSAEGDDGITNLDEMQSMGGYFILEKKCTEENI